VVKGTTKQDTCEHVKLYLHKAGAKCVTGGVNTVCGGMLRCQVIKQSSSAPDRQ
jgi:hypothetical protein